MASITHGRTSQAALSLATSANGVARNGTALVTTRMCPGTLVARAVSLITTASVVATFKWQYTKDGSTWHDVKDTNATASTTTAAGTGSEVETDWLLCPPLGLVSGQQVRVVATLSGASTAAADKTSVTYDFLDGTSNPRVY